MKKLDKILDPKSIAIVGASAKLGSVGNELIRRVCEFGFKGKVYAVHPKEKQIEGVEAFAKVYDIPETVDVAIIAVNASIVPEIVDDCNKAGIKNIVVISSGFKEVGKEGEQLEKAVVDKVREYGMTMIGPNCLGVINTDPALNLDACFAPLLPMRGNIGFATQSGALASGIINILPSLRVGISQMVSLGNQADVNALDVIEQWEDDPRIGQILLYMESIQEPKRFREVATRVSKKKPILAIKSGRSESGAKATASHTGSLAGDDTTAQGLLASCGVIRELYLRDLFNTAQVLGHCGLPAGKNLAILTNAGGPGILATDTAADMDLDLAKLSDKTKQILRGLLPSQASVNNPVDMIASASAEDYHNCAETLLKAKEVDMLVVIYLYITGKNDINILADLENLKIKYPHKPIVAVFMTTPDLDERAKAEIPNCTVPIFNFMADGLRGLKRLWERRQFLDSSNVVAPVYDADKSTVESIIAKAREEGLTQLTTAQSLDIFKAYGMPMPRYGVAQTLADAKKIAASCGYPAVLKLSSKKLSHKTDVGGVITNIKTEQELGFWWERLVARLNKAGIADTLDGIVVMQQVEGTTREFVAGVVDKAGYGHQMMFGLGGIFVETLKEVAFRPCPLTHADAQALIDGTKAKNIMGFVRGGTAADKREVAECLMRLSQLVKDFPEIAEIDANPIMLDDKGHLFAVDARIVLAEKAGNTDN